MHNTTSGIIKQILTYLDKLSLMIMNKLVELVEAIILIKFSQVLERPLEAFG